MIQLSALAAAGPDNSLKTATFAGLTAVFESLLAGETEGAAEPGGKILPEGGKVLPDALPASLIFAAAQRKPTAKLAELPHETAEAEADPDGDESATEAHTDTSESDTDRSLAGVELALIPQIANVDREAETPVEGFAESSPRQSFRHAGSHPVPAEVRQVIREAGTAPAEQSARSDGELASRSTTTTPAALTAITAAMRAPVHTEGARSAIEGEKPADAPQPSRIAPASRPEPIREIRFELSGDARGESSADRSAPRQSGLAPLLAQPTAAVELPATSPVESASAVAPVGKGEAPVPMTQQPAQAVRPQDLDALVDRLVEARDNARAGNASVTVMHEDFGKVSLRFTHENGGLSVTMANNDPGFARAVNAAVAPDPSMNGEAQSQAERRSEGGQGNGMRTATSEHGGTGERGNDARGQRAGRGEPMANPHPGAADDGRKPRGGIFA